MKHVCDRCGKWVPKVFRKQHKGSCLGIRVGPKRLRGLAGVKEVWGKKCVSKDFYVKVG